MTMTRHSEVYALDAKLAFKRRKTVVVATLLLRFNNTFEQAVIVFSLIMSSGKSTTSHLLSLSLIDSWTTETIRNSRCLLLFILGSLFLSRLETQPIVQPRPVVSAGSAHPNRLERSSVHDYIVGRCCG